MGKRRNKRISVTVGDELHARLGRMRKSCGFATIGEMATAMLRLLADAIDEARDRGELLPTPTEEIAEMFGEYAYWERQPDGTVPKRPHTPRRDG